MKVFIVHAHAESQSFNGSLTRHAKKVLEAAGHEVIISDLYAMNFNPVSDRHNFTSQKNPDYFKQQIEEMYATEVNGFASDIQAEIEKLEWCDVLIMQFPLWWFSLPAILKGWVDRTFAMGKIYGGGKWYDNGVFRGKKAMLSLTTGGPENMYTAIGINGNINEILFPIHHGILRFVGFDVLPPFIAWAIAHADEEKRQAYLNAYQERLLKIAETEPIFYPSLSDYDDRFQLKSK
ncbi:NAD(P)H-dependent oxidoreductase [Phormidium sp. LEGE 05292]|uniref:NAD(P)H-dependent oxidoreductase n=1 Tax=[Phormidium] sp. LEGE 05292 TaxID=767427 RepID=UPI00187EDBD9|nr:NAD(P)H-dependent oxidoreductase [Phormidium sp. LEGE 05292]MBE9229599.1 NAD(P)H-dependent oxidoreductase [Phormidium sp. LEGE 05292]